MMSSRRKVNFLYDETLNKIVPCIKCYMFGWECSFCVENEDIQEFYSYIDYDDFRDVLINTYGIQNVPSSYSDFEDIRVNTIIEDNLEAECHNGLFITNFDREEYEHHCDIRLIDRYTPLNSGTDSSSDTDDDYDSDDPYGARIFEMDDTEGVGTRSAGDEDDDDDDDDEYIPSGDDDRVSDVVSQRSGSDVKENMSDTDGHGEALSFEEISEDDEYEPSESDDEDAEESDDEFNPVFSDEDSTVEDHPCLADEEVETDSDDEEYEAFADDEPSEVGDDESDDEEDQSQRMVVENADGTIIIEIQLDNNSQTTNDLSGSRAFSEGDNNDLGGWEEYTSQPFNHNVYTDTPYSLYDLRQRVI